MKKKAFYLISFAVFAFACIIAYQLYSSIKEQEYISSYNLKFSGIIKKKMNLSYGHDFGYALIEMVNPNLNDVDPRKQNENYFFVIRNGKCVLLIPGVSDIEIGDSIVVNENRYSSYRENIKIRDNHRLEILPKILYDNPDGLFK